jgi:iron complex transport system permease protein
MASLPLDLRAPGLAGLRLWAGLGLALLLVALLNLRLGAVPVSTADLLALAGVGKGDAAALMVLRDIRLPRLVCALVSGAALALSGAALQALFRNPLAEPALLGVSTGAALGAAGFIIGGAALVARLPVLGPFGLPLAGFLGALLAVALVLLLSRRSGPEAALLMLLVGIGVNALGGAVIGLLGYIGSDAQLRALSVWLLGSLAQVEWAVLVPAALLITLAALGLLRSHRALDLLALGEESARHLGLRSGHVRRRVALMAALATGAAVAMAGVIGFVGLVVPHMVRSLLGPGHRRLLPASALGGAFLVALADLLARTIALPAEIPVGILLAIGGAPAFLWILLSRVPRT